MRDIEVPFINRPPKGANVGAVSLRLSLKPKVVDGGSWEGDSDRSLEEKRWNNEGGCEQL